jgi:uncharacterized phage protein (TIGR02220 family)
MNYDELIAEREKLQIKLAGIEKELLKFGDPAREILEFLNQKAHRKYRPTAANLRMIRCRLKEGFTADECRQVIARKCREWGKDEKMKNYLRPATLFNATKFSQYSGELI